jgi:NitT/TauT family transport system permease protein
MPELNKHAPEDFVTVVDPGASIQSPAGAGHAQPPSIDLDDEPVLLKRRSFKGVWLRLASLAVLVLGWYVASLFFSSSILPSPGSVISVLGSNLKEHDTYFQLYKTLIRVVGGMCFAVIVGMVVGIVMGLSESSEYFLDSWVLVAFTVPSIVYGIVCILWFGLTDFAAVIAIGVTAMPSVALNIWQGTKAIDTSLVRMAKAFHFRRRSIIFKVVIPQLVPYVLAAFRYALGASWKVATVVELIGLSSGVGYELNYWFGLFNMKQVLAWTLTFTIALLLIEFLVFKPAEMWLTRWRPSAQR